VDASTAAYYSLHAAELSRRYESVQGGVATLFPWVFQRGTQVLDVGAGSGRDMVRLAEAGMEPWGLEPVDALREEALRLHPQLKGRLAAGGIPGELPATLPRSFDGIVLSAVLMHVPDAELFEAAFCLRGWLRDGGRLLISVPTERPDLDPADEERDLQGRLMVLRPVERLRLLFERLGFSQEGEWHSADGLERPGVRWVSLVFRLRGETPRPIDRLESIINRDRKTATYKLALLRALCDMALTAWPLARWEPDGTVSVPLSEIAKRWLLYYWPIIEADGALIPQTAGEYDGSRRMAFRSALSELVGNYRKIGGLPAFLADLKGDSFDAHTRRLTSSALAAVGRTIVRGPVVYAGGARGERIFRFDGGTSRVRFDQELWRELVLMGHWVRDALILRWAELTSALSHRELPPSRVLDLLLAPVEGERQDAAARVIYASQSSLECVWTGRSVSPRALEVDHAIPFTLWQDSSLWNLLPSSRQANNSKRDRLPERGLLLSRREAIIHSWSVLEQELPQRFRREADRLTGTAAENRNWEATLFSAFGEAVEYTASVRGVERWAP